MTRRILAAALLALGALAGPAFAAAPPPDGSAQNPPRRGTFKVGATLDHASGDTRYRMEALTMDPRGTGELVPIASELIFPLDTYRLGLRAAWDPASGAFGPWSFAAEIRFNVNDPSTRMTNSDFFGGRPIFYTQSEGDLDWFQADLVVRYRLSGAWALLLQMEYQRVTQHLVDFEGWQGSLFSDVRTPTSGTGPVLDYRVTYAAPRIGAEVGFGLGKSLRLTFLGSGGILLASDRDDHIIRNRISEGDGTGFSLHSRVSLDLLPGILPVPWLLLSLGGEIGYCHAEGTSDQWFYDAAGRPTGEEIRDLAYTMESLQGRLALSLTAAF